MDDPAPQASDPAATSFARRAVDKAWRVLRPVLVVYLLIMLFMTILERTLVYPVPPPKDGDWQPAALDYEDVRFESEDGTRLHGWYVPHPQPKRALVFFHGNGEHVAYNADLVAQLRDELSATVFIFDYRGYGRSAGKPFEAGVIADGIAAQQWLANRLGIATREIVLMGRSLGTGVAIAAAAEQGAKAIVLVNAFDRMVDVAAGHYPWLPVKLLMRNRYDSLARIQHYTGPVFQSHGTVDVVVPIEHGRRLFEAVLSDRKQFVEIPNRGHNDPPPPGYFQQLAAFLDGQGP